MAGTRALDAAEWEFWDTWLRAQRLLLQDLDRDLQRGCGISKAEFSVLVTLHRADGDDMRVSDLVDALGWEKSRVSHQLTRMQERRFVQRTDCGASGRRTRIGLTAKGRSVAADAILVHGRNIRRRFLDSLTPEQAATIRAWSEQIVADPV